MCFSPNFPSRNGSPGGLGLCLPCSWDARCLKHLPGFSWAHATNIQGTSQCDGRQELGWSQAIHRVTSLGLEGSQKKKKKQQQQCATRLVWMSLDRGGTVQELRVTEAAGQPGALGRCSSARPRTPAPAPRDSCLWGSTSVCYPLCLRDPPSQKQGRGCQRPPDGGY